MLKSMRVQAGAAETGPALRLLAGGRATHFMPGRNPAAPIEPDTLPASLFALALDSMAEAAMFIGRGGRIAYANRAARTLLDAGDVLRDVGGHLSSSDPAQRAALNTIIADAAAGGQVGAVSLIRRDGTRVNLTAVAGEAGGPAQVLLLAAEMRRGEGHIAAQLQQAFGLTAAEADIARSLGNGDCSADIAVARGASPGTVHCQIKSIAAKLGCRRRTEIATIVQAMPRVHSDPVRAVKPAAVA